MTATAYAGKGLSPPQRVSGKPFTVDHWCRWARRFRLKDGSRYEPDEYQILFLEDLFARELDGRPTFQELWLVVPEGNGKTTFVTLVCLYVIEFMPEAWVPVAAAARDQAVDLTYRLASGFVTRNRMQEQFKLHPGYRQIVHRESLGALKIFASDAASGDGVDPTMAVIEELHRLPVMELYETWSGKLEKSGGQLLVVSTAGEPGAAFEELRERMREDPWEVTRDRCFARTVTPGAVMHEYSLPRDGDWDDLELVAAANPSPRITVETLRRKRNKRSWRLPHWLRFVCNVPTRSDDAAITEAEWDAAATPERIPAGEPRWLGLDVAWKWDTTALVPLWVRDREFRLLGPATILEPPRDGNSLDPALVEKALLDEHKRGPIHTVVMDTTRAEQLASWIESTLGATVIDRGQSNTLAAMDYERFMEALRLGWLRHAGDAGLRQHALNAVVRMLPDGKIKFDRRKSTRKGGNQEARVIDALVAASMVHTTAAAEFDADEAGGWGAA